MMTKQDQKRILIPNRRDFIKTSALATIAIGVHSSVASAGFSTSPNEKLNVACIGISNRGSANVGGVASQNMVAICDVDENFLKQQGERFPNAKRYRDYRVMLDKEEANIDAVVVSTPDHHHAPASIRALRMKKHVYCEKPLTHTVKECRLMAELAKEHKLVTQMGTQIHAGDNYRRVVEKIQAGAIGDVQKAYSWIGNKPWFDGRFSEEKPIPKTLDWDLWLGPAKMRPYSTGLHPASWRKFWEYGNGNLGDMGCHFIDLIFWALKLRHPTEVWAEGPEPHEVGAPKWLTSSWKFPARENMVPVTVTWMDGPGKPEEFKKIAEQFPNQAGPFRGAAQMFIGSKGILLSNYGQHVLLPVDQYKDYEAPKQSIPRSIGHHNEWIEACKTGGTTTCNFDYSGALTESVLLGTLAFRTGERFMWNGADMRSDKDSVNQLLDKEYRKNWGIE